jgi:FixJ family two-component response regulator
MTAASLVIAIVDDDDSVRRALRRLMVSLSFRPVDYSSGEAFLSSLETCVPACVLLDLHMPGRNGLQVLEAMRQRGIKVPAVVITANMQTEMRDQCMEAGAVAYLNKPLERDLVLSVIQRATMA